MRIFKNNNDEKYNFTDEELEVLERYEEMQQAMIDKDIDKLNEIVENGTTFTHMSGKIQTKEEYFEEIRNSTLNYYKYKIVNPKIQVNDNKAKIEAVVRLTAKVYGIPGMWPLNITAYFEKINDKWYYRNKF